MTTTHYHYKSKAGTVILGLLFGGLGFHRFYLGHAGIGLAFLISTLLSLVLMPPAGFAIALVALIDSIVILFRSPLYFRRVLTVAEVG